MLLQRVTPLFLSILVCFSFSSNDIAVHGSSSLAEKTVNDLNTVLKYCIGQMIYNNFFYDSWITYFPKVLPTAIPNNCKDGRIVPIKDADESLRSVLNNGTLRIGIHIELLGTPYLLISNESDTSTKSKESDSSNAKNSTRKSNTSSTELAFAAGTIDGYEPVCIREVTRLLGSAYQMDIRPEFVLIKGDNFFDSLKAAVDSNQVDVVWSIVTVSDERAKQVNYVCNNHMSEYVIGASAKVGSKFPNPAGPAISLGCFGISCTFTNIPAPFVLKPVSLDAETFALSNTTDEIEYTLTPYENLWNFIRTKCANCTQVDTPETIGEDTRAPFTKFYDQTSSKTSSSTRLMMITTMVSLILSVLCHVVVLSC